MTTTEISTCQLDTPEATVVYDVRGPLPPADGRPPLVMIGAPMGAEGFATLASFFADRTVVTYDPRGIGRGERLDGRHDHTPEQNATDVHHVIEALGGGPVDLFGSSGGAVTALALVAAHPDDVRVAVAHEPPLLTLLPDADAALEAELGLQDAYRSSGFGAGMAGFIALTSWQGPFTADFLSQAAPDPAQFGLPVDDDGGRDDPLLSGASNAVTRYRPDVAALAAAPTTIVVGAGVESRQTVTGRTAAATADLLGVPLVTFPSHHGGFMGGEFGQAGEPEAFAATLRPFFDDPS